MLSEEVNRARLLAINEQKKYRRDANIEVEIQFGTYLQPDVEKKETIGRFITTVSPAAYQRVLQAMKRISPKYTTSETEDEISKSERVSYDLKSKKTEYYEKKRIYNSYDLYYNKEEKDFVSNSSTAGNRLAQEFNMKITVANEYRYTSESKYFRPNIKRLKKRTTFDFKDQYGGYLDMTVVEEQYLDEKDERFGTTKTKFEVEFEVVESFDKYITKIEKLTQLILVLLQDTVVPYTNSEKEYMYEYVSDLLGISINNIKFSMLPEARDLKLTDMVYGGVVGNTATPYCVTHKADGVRKLIVTTPRSIWAFVPGTQEANQIYKFEETEDNRIPPFQEGFIFDGELLTKESRKDSNNCRYMFYIFDCLCENKQDIRDKNYMERMELALQFTEYPFIEVQNLIGQEENEIVKFREFKINDNKINRAIKFVVKGYLSLVSVEHFFETMRLMFLQQDQLAFKQDGFMFIPMNTVYNPYDPVSPLPLVYRGDNKVLLNAPPIYQRSLVQYPDICKWKPVELRSIDFVVEKSRSKIQLKALDGKVLRVFNGSGTYPLSDRIDSHHPLLQNLPPNTIVEFYWDAKKQLLTPSRIRSDKPAPNRYQIAEIVWENIFEGIDPQTLIGESFQLMRTYHNLIKKQLFEQAKRSRNHRVLLDIGSGRSAEISGWTGFDMIFAVEPNKEHAQELMERLQVADIHPNKVVLIPTGGEDYQTITDVIHTKYGEKVSTVSLMLSLSFFYGDKREGLKKTIENNLEDGGEVLILTIDGDTVKQVFHPSSGEYSEKTLKFLNADLTYKNSSGMLYIDLPGTIVSRQAEKPPKLGELFQQWNKFFPLKISRADKQKFLNSGEKPFSNMYSSFILIRLSDEISKIEIERIVPYEPKTGRLVNGEKDYSPVENWTFLPGAMYGISVFPSDYLYLSAVLKAIDPEYQNNNNMKFRKTYVVQVWNTIQKTLSVQQRQIYTLPWNINVLQIFSDVFEVSILYVKEQQAYRFGKYPHKIVIVDSYVIGIMNDRGLLQTKF